MNLFDIPIKSVKGDDLIIPNGIYSVRINYANSYEDEESASISIRYEIIEGTFKGMMLDQKIKYYKDSNMIESRELFEEVIGKLLYAANLEELRGAYQLFGLTLFVKVLNKDNKLKIVKYYR